MIFLRGQQEQSQYSGEGWRKKKSAAF